MCPNCESENVISLGDGEMECSDCGASFDEDEMYEEEEEEDDDEDDDS